MDTFDYVIVGAGSAGCVIARRLTDSGRGRVLLLEAGPEDRNFWIHFTIGVGKTIADPSVNWMLKSEPEPAAGGRRLAVPRGKVLGGSSSINGGVYVRGNPADYDGWSQKGCRGWSYEDVLPCFRRAETFTRGANAVRGGDGPLGVDVVRERDGVLDALIDSAAELGYPRNEDLNAGTQDGFSYSQTTTRGGWRNSAARAYLRPVRNRPGLTVMTGATVERILFTGRRATGVAYRIGGERREARAASEVILCAGAVHSPAILERSGIGDATHLSALGIDVLVDRPGVGENLQDHWAVWMKWRIRDHLTLNERTRGWRAVVEGLKFAFFRTGALTMPAGPMMGFVKTRPELDLPDVQYHATPLTFANPETRQLDRFPGFTISTLVLRPRSRGSVHVDSADPDTSPRIRFNAFSDPYDIDTLVAGIDIARSIVAGRPMARFQPEELEPSRRAQTEDELRDFVRSFGNSCYHLAGTCRMGTDNGAVVDPALRVRGVEGLRVADASIMPDIVSGNTNAAAIMIGEKAADLILADAAARRSAA